MTKLFQLSGTDGNARFGVLHLPHGRVETPVFMPVATAAALKGVFPRDAAHSGVSMLLANTFHLMLRPGTDLVKSFGGLHGFMNWQKPILTDSGGYQVFSLKELRTLTENGVTFRSPLDGSSLFLSPEIATQAQLDLGADIVMCLDECTPYPATQDQAATSMRLSLKWAKSCRAVWQKETREALGGRALFGIVQGGMYLSLRRICLEKLTEIGFEGYALGGLSVGEPAEDRSRVLEGIVPDLPVEKPRYLMGVGTPSDIVEAVCRGIDMFDCVLPTRNARNGQLFTARGKLNLRNAAFKNQNLPPDEGCACYCCRNFSLGYLHHLFRCKEMLGPQLASLHNIFYYRNLLFCLREAIKNGKLNMFVKDFYSNLLQ